MNLTELHRLSESVVLEQMFEGELRCTSMHDANLSPCAVEARWLVTRGCDGGVTFWCDPRREEHDRDCESGLWSCHKCDAPVEVCWSVRPI